MVHTHSSAEIQIAIAVVKTLILVVGGVVTYLAWSAYRRTGDRSLKFLSVGFAFVGIGVLIAGFTFEILGTDIGIGVLIEGLFILTGLSVIAYSLRVQ
jgi:heme/copper-type cytochrome/quinol oxidase subunit 3